MVTCEAEYLGLTEVGNKWMFVTLLFTYIGSGINTLVIYCDNNSAINLAKHPTNHRNSNHISIKYNCVRDLVNLALV